MSKKQKLLKRLLSKPKDLRFDEIDRILIMCNYKQDRSSGSHFSYKKAGRHLITIPRKSPVKIPYIMMVLNEIEDDIEEFL